MHDLDVRDLEGRFGRLVAAISIGAILAVPIAALLPQESMRGWGAGAFGLANPVLVIAGACVIALGVNALLHATRSRTPPIRVPRATTRRRR
ncbi:MAG TPA: hypothetical protein VFV99_14620 [Kofleriaceae bacterium]|nr:hypothetical protein [Kofleriaceae bacterium]